MIRIGNGYDVHAYTEGDHITLGGVRIPHTKAFLAHSDGDVLIHALCDALLGALALGDIGQHFPDDDANFKNIDSRKLLKHVNDLITTQYYRLLNCDCTIVAQTPRMAPHIKQMKQNLAQDLNVSTNKVSVKATTTEQLGFTGREEGVSVYAVVLLQKFVRETN